MKNLKAILLGSVIAFASVTTLVTSCTEDKCKDVVCNNGGSCAAETGLCICKSGFEGTNCSTLSLSKFLGATNGAATYNFSDAGTVACGGTFTGSFTMSRSNADSTRLILTNFGGFGATVTAYANANNNTLTIPSQTLTNTTPAITVAGTGTYASGVVTGTYTSTDLTGSCTYNFTWTKQ
jgi:hypothetical protein